MSEERERVKMAVPELEKHGAKLDRAIDTVLRGGVKECRFLPSGRKLTTVVGKLGDEFIDPRKPYCSCSNFFFGFLEGKEGLCYHLLSYEVASKVGKVDVINFSDEEYIHYLIAVVGDVFETLERRGG